MVKLGATHSPALLKLLAADGADVDYIQFYPGRGMDALRVAVQHRPVFIHDLPEPFWLNYDQPFGDETMSLGRAMLDLSQSPWLSTGIGASAEPQGHRDGPYREADDEALQSRQQVIDNILRNGRRLRDWAGVPLLLENYNYHPTNAYEYICEPELFSELIGKIGCEVLLDLAHAQISANNMGWQDSRSYIAQLPLEKVREVHINRPLLQDGTMYDMHSPHLQAEDLDLLGWVLERSPVQAVTFEVEDVDEAALSARLSQLRAFLNGK